MTNPIIFAVAGIPASGKSSFIQEKMKENFFPEEVFIHDCDAVMASLKDYQSDLQTLGSAQAFTKWELPARALAESMLMEAVHAKKNIIYDRSCALQSSYLFLKEVVELHQYALVMHVLAVSNEVAFSRAEEREKETGRQVPKKYFIEREKGLKALWPAYLKLAKQCCVYDSNTRPLQLIASGCDPKLTILDKKKYALFLKR